MKKPRKLSHNDKAALRVALCIERGHVLHSHNALVHEDTTVGPYREAVDRWNRYAVIGVRGKSPEALFKTPIEAAYVFVERVGSTRANDVARDMAKRERFAFTGAAA